MKIENLNTIEMIKQSLQMLSRLVPICLLLACTQHAFGQEATAKSDSTAKFDVKKRQKEMKLFMDKIEILGKIEKPQTVFIVQGKDPSVDDIQIDRSFFKEIFRKIEKDEIRKIARKSALKKAGSKNK